MAEGIGTGNPFSSGGHRWTWGDREGRAKEFVVPGVAGAGRMILTVGPRTGLVEGILKGTGATRALADSGLDTLEGAIQALAESGAASAWEDDQGHTGASLVVVGYAPQGPRQYAPVAGTWNAWQPYRTSVRELDGAL